MKLFRFVFALLIGLIAGIPAHADNVVITYSPAKQTAPNFSSTSPSGICYQTTTCDYGQENFTGWSGSSVFNSTFKDAGSGTFNQPNGVSFSGTFTAGTGTTTGSGGEWISVAQNEYGGVNNQNYPELYGPTASQVTHAGTASTATYTLTLSSTGVPGINYFGVWISALDANNNLTIYDGSTVVAQFNSAVLEALLGSCPGSPANAYCGNPTTQFSGQDSNELFAYVNVFDLTGYITSVTFSNAAGTGFESTNDVVAYADPIHVTGTPIPEPASLSVLGLATGLLLRIRRKASRARG
jgi:hypothetical protein